MTSSLVDWRINNEETQWTQPIWANLRQASRVIFILGRLIYYFRFTWGNSWRFIIFFFSCSWNCQRSSDSQAIGAGSELSICERILLWVNTLSHMNCTCGLTTHGEQSNWDSFSMSTGRFHLHQSFLCIFYHVVTCTITFISIIIIRRSAPYSRQPVRIWSVYQTSSTAIITTKGGVRIWRHPHILTSADFIIGVVIGINWNIWKRIRLVDSLWKKNKAIGKPVEKE